MAVFVVKRAVRMPPITALFGKADQADIERLLAADDRITAQVRQAYVDAVQRLGASIDVEHIASLLAQVARDIRQYIGLTERQAQAVRNYRRMLEDGDGQALQRQLRDRRFDSSVRRHVAGDRALSNEQVDRLVDRYAQRYLRYRADTIARTEAKRSLGAGNQLLWNQSVDAGKVAEADVTKTWITVGDHKVRPFHQELNKNVVGLNEKFTCSGGDIMYPGDPGADTGMTINCRCACVYRFKVR